MMKQLKLVRLTVWTGSPRCISLLWSVWLILIAVSLLSSSDTLAFVTPEAPRTSTTGHYVVRFSPGIDGFFWLEEKAGATGNWGRVDTADTWRDD